MKSVTILVKRFRKKQKEAEKMTRIFGFIALILITTTLAACNTDMTCGEGTVLSDGACVLVGSEEDTQESENGLVSENDHTAYEVVNGDFENAPTEPWFFIGGWMVNDPDNIWMSDSQAIIFDVTDEALATRNVWDGAFWQPKIYTEAGYTYTVSFTLRTDEVDGRDVILFLEDTDNNFFKFFEETVTLGLEYQTYTYTFDARIKNNDTKVGLFFANDVGTVIIDSVHVERSITQ